VSQVEAPGEGESILHDDASDQRRQRGKLGIGEVDRRHRGEWLDEASVYDAARPN
jgi:hypothetical protein